MLFDHHGLGIVAMHDNNGKIVKKGTILYFAYDPEDHFVKTYEPGLLRVFFSFLWFIFFWGANAYKE